MVGAGKRKKKGQKLKKVYRRMNCNKYLESKKRVKKKMGKTRGGVGRGEGVEGEGGCLCKKRKGAQNPTQWWGDYKEGGSAIEPIAIGRAGRGKHQAC